MGGTMRWAELRMCRFWAGGISSFPFSRAREYRLLRRLMQNRSGDSIVPCGTPWVIGRADDLVDPMRTYWDLPVK